jgi:hypothetical protein
MLWYTKEFVVKWKRTECQVGYGDDNDSGKETE